MLQMDNKTVVAYLMKQGGTKSVRLLKMTFAIFELLGKYNIHLIARYLPGRYNGIADSLSRCNQLPEWHLSRKIIQIIIQKFGQPQVDLFASKNSAVTNVYVSEDARDQEALFIDAFTRTWHFELGYAFPPPGLIPRVLHHLDNCTGSYLLVAPNWEKTFWQPMLKQRAVVTPMTIHNLENHLIDLRTGRPPPAIESLQLQVWKIRSGPIS